MEKPKQRRNGLPYCHEQMIYLLRCAGGTLTREEIRKTLFQMGYSYYCVYEAFRRLDDKEIITLEGSGHSPTQLVHLNDSIKE